MRTLHDLIRLRERHFGTAPFTVMRPVLSVGNRGPHRQLMWAVNNWIRPYIARVKAGVPPPRDAQGRVVMPVEPNWKVSGTGRIKYPYGEDWLPTGPARKK